MHRRFLFPLAAGVVGLVAISPVFAAEPSPAKAGSGPAKATTTSASSSSSGSSNTDPSSTDSTDSSSGANTAPTTAGKGNSTPTTAAPGPGPGQGGSGSGPGGGSGSSGGAPGSSSNCAPAQTDQGPAPQVGEAPQNHGAGDAGTVDVERLSASELRVAKASANDGWTQQVTAPSGPRVTVKFSHPGGSPSVVRFAASMDQAGRMIHIRVQACG